MRGNNWGERWTGREVIWGYIFENREITDKIFIKGTMASWMKWMSLAGLAQPLKGYIFAP